MKNRFYLNLCVSALFAVGVFSACTSSEDYLKVVPSDSSVLVSLDLASMAQKGDVANNAALKMLEGVALTSYPADTQKLLQSVFEDPEKSGLDFAKPMVVSLRYEDKQPEDEVVALDIEVSAVWAVKNAADLESVVEQLLPGTIQIEEKEGIKIIDNPKYTLAFDKNTLLLSTAERDAVSGYFNQPSSQQLIRTDKEFARFLETKADIASYCNYSTFHGLSDQLNMGGQMDSLMACCKDVKAVVFTNFENGRVVSNSKIVNFEKLPEYMRKWSHPSGRALDFLPVNSAFVVNFKVLSDIASAKMFVAATQLETELKSVGLTPADLTEIQGEGVLSLIDFNANHVNYLVKLPLKSDKIWQVIKGYCTHPNIVQENDSLYSMETPYGKGYFGFAENSLFCMSDSLHQIVLPEGQYVDVEINYNGNRLSSIIGQRTGVALDFKVLAACLRSLGDNQLVFVSEALDRFDYWTTIGEMNGTSESVIQMADKQTNALKQLIDICQTTTLKLK
ncbi:MAG: DUF4836 family protein [Bacteroidales bacterium]|nr:DUF4836 family protein [Bacteroidales bacterium]